MNLKEARESYYYYYYYYSGRVSDLCRQFAFAGIALIWILGLGETATARLPDDLVWPGILIVATLILDFLQNVTATLIWGAFGRFKERHGTTADDDFEAPASINWIQLGFFWLKVATLAAAYVMLGIYMVDRL